MTTSATLSVVVPVFNEGKTVHELLSEVWKVELLDGVKKEIIVVVSPSTDESEAEVRRFQAEHKDDNERSLQVLVQEKARGKGNAVRQGFSECTGDVVLIQDADLEYDVKDYNEVILPILSGKTDLVLGSRHLAAGNWKIRKFDEQPIRAWALNLGGFLFHTVFNVIYRQELSDPTTMYKVFRREYLKRFDLVSNRFDFDFELLAKLIRSGAKPMEVPISYESRDFEEGKKIRPFRDPIGWLWAIVRFRFVPLKQSETDKEKVISALKG